MSVLNAKKYEILEKEIRTNKNDDEIKLYTSIIHIWNGNIPILIKKPTVKKKTIVLWENVGKKVIV